MFGTMVPASILSSTSGCYVLGVVSPGSMLGVGLVVLVPLDQCCFVFLSSYMYEGFLFTLYRFGLLCLFYKGGGKVKPVSELT